MDIGLARDRRCVAERLRDGFEHRLEADVVPSRGERVEREHARAPRAEMLGGEILAHRLADIIVDVGRADRMRPARLIDPGEPRPGGSRVGEEWVTTCRTRWSPYH